MSLFFITIQELQLQVAGVKLHWASTKCARVCSLGENEGMGPHPDHTHTQTRFT
jgi:hypothetical protein